MPTLCAQDVTVQFKRGSHPAVDRASFSIESGAAVGIVGESGSGKTTLARTLVGALTPTSGTITVDGQSWSQIGRRDALRKSVQMIFQDPYGSLNPCRRAIDTVATAYSLWHRESRRAARARASQLLEEVGVAEAASRRRPQRLSGGQCQRVGIARALACEPAVLVADEPTSSLDVSVQAQILNLLVDLRRERQLALILISHDLSVVRYATERLIVMYRGTVVETGLTERVLAQPAHPYTRLLLDCVPGSGRPRHSTKNKSSNGGCPFAHSCPEMTPECDEKPPSLEPHDGQMVACLHPISGD